MLAYKWRGKTEGKILDTYDKLQKRIGSAEGWSRSNWIQDPRCMLFNSSELLLFSPFEILMDLTKDFIYGQQRLIHREKQNDGRVWHSLCYPKRQSLSPQHKCILSKRFSVVLLALGPSLTTWKHLATKVFCLHRAYATKSCRNTKTVSSKDIFILSAGFKDMQREVGRFMVLS